MDRILAWAKAPTGDITLGGYAGTGKTTCLRYITEALPHAQVMTPTGRAAQVLRRKGVPCETIHSVLYNYAGTYEDRRGREVMSFSPKAEVDTPPLWVIDESSMVNMEMFSDIKAHAVPCLWVGDHGQLPPIGGDPGLMRNPTIRLERIHRQAEGSAILTLAHAVRGGAAPSLQESSSVSVRRADSLLTLVDRWIAGGYQVAVAYNKTRMSINRYWRQALGRQGQLETGERLICLFNDRSRSVYNGTMLVVTAIQAETEHGWLAKVEDDGGNVLALNLWRGALAGAEWRSEEKPRDHVAVDYAYAITVHKAQGGQWPAFAVLDQPCKTWDMRRWRYTSYTRASEKLLVHI